MPDYGALGQDKLPHSLPIVSPLYPPPPWPLPGAQVLKILFETDTEPVLDWLPPRLSRSSPPYAVVTIARYPESPVGPFSLACQYIGCRAAFFIRAYGLQAVVDSPRALSALREVWGVPCKPGEVSLESDERSAKAVVTRNGAPVAEAGVESLEPVDPGIVRFDPVLNVRLFASLQEGKRHDAVQMVQVDPDYEIKDAFRGAGRLSYPGGNEEDPWGLLPVRNIISAVLCTMDTELPLARYVMPY